MVRPQQHVIAMGIGDVDHDIAVLAKAGQPEQRHWMTRRNLEQCLKVFPGFLVQSAFGQVLREPQPGRVGRDVFHRVRDLRGTSKFLRGRDDVD